MSTTTAQSAQDHDPRVFFIERVIAAPRERVFAAWIDPAQVSQWFGPRGFSVPRCEIDARPGGALLIVMREPDGTDYPLHGQYIEVTPPERIVYTEDCSQHPESWHDLIDPERKLPGRPVYPARVTVRFEALDANRTRLSVETLFAAAEVRDAFVNAGMKEGWGQTLDRLQELTSPTA